MMTIFRSRSIQGFTLPEIMLSLLLLGIIGAMSVPAYLAFMIRTDLHDATITLVEKLRKAEVLSQGGAGDTSWGVKVSVGSILLFKGASHITRDQAFDENVSIPTTIVPSGMTEVVFSKGDGFPYVTGTFVLTSQANETKTVTINEKGMVDY